MPAIVNQSISRFEVIVVGRYAGQFTDAPWLSVVRVERFPYYFYRPHQLGVDRARFDWVVDLGDDMVLDAGWYEALLAACALEKADVYGFSLLLPDGSMRTLVADIWGIGQADDIVRDTSYFGSSVVRRWIFGGLPYPTYMSGDRQHGLQLCEAGFKRVLASGAYVIHYGDEGYEGRCAPERYERVQALKRRLGWYARTVDPGYVDGMRSWWSYAQKMERYPKRLGIVGWFGHANVGDELILQNMLAELGDHRIVVFTDVPDCVQGGARMTAEPLSALPGLLNDLDVLLVGGGGVLRDYYIRSILPPESLTDLRTPIIVYAAGVPFFEWTDNLAYFLDRCYLISIRDQSSRDFLRKKFPDLPVLHLPDPGFLTPRADNRRMARKVVLNIRSVPQGWRMGLPRNVDEITKTQAEALYTYLTGNGHEVHVLGFEPRDAQFLCSSVWDHRIVDVPEAIREIASAECVVAMRYHAGVLAFTQGVPALMLDYQNKVSGLAQVTGGTTYVVPISGLDLVGAFREFQESRVEGMRAGVGTARLKGIQEQVKAFHRLYGLALRGEGQGAGG